MIDFTDQIVELQECKNNFDVFGQRLFELHAEAQEENFSTQEMFAISAQIIYVRKRVADSIVDIYDRLQDEGDYLDLEQDEDEDDLMEVIHEAFENDHDLVPIMIEELAVLKRNNLALSFIARYQDILLSVVEYCKTGDRQFLQKKFRKISEEDMF